MHYDIQIPEISSIPEPAEGNIGIFLLPFERLRKGAALGFGVNCLHAGGRCFYYRPSRNTRIFENSLPDTGSSVLVAARKNNHGQYVLRWVNPGENGLRILYREPVPPRDAEAAMYLASACCLLASALCFGLFLSSVEGLLSASAILALTGAVLYAVGRFAVRRNAGSEMLFDELWELARKGRPLGHPVITESLEEPDLLEGAGVVALMTMQGVVLHCESLSITEGFARDTAESRRLGAFGSWHGRIPWLFRIMPPKFAWAFRVSDTLLKMFASSPNGLPEDWDAHLVPPCLVDDDRVIAVHNSAGTVYGLINLEDMRAYTGKVLDVSSATVAGGILCGMAVALVGLWNVLEMYAYGWTHFWETSGVDLLLLFGGTLVILVMLACLIRDGLVTFISDRPRDPGKKEHERLAVEAIRAYNVAKPGRQARIEP